MKAFFMFVAALLAIFGLAGCVSSRGTDKSELPPDWIAALPKPGSVAPDLAGIYVERGERLDARFARKGTVGSTNLSTFLSTMLGGSAEAARRRSRAGSTVELRRADDSHLELIVKTGDEITDRTTLEAAFEKNTGAMVLRDARTITSGKSLAAVHATMTYRFWRAADNRLYAHGTSHAVGGVLLVVPTVLSSEWWCRWDPATPEALQKQAAAQAVEAASVEHRNNVNRNRAAEGAKAPLFDGANDFLGRPITSVTYAGKVVVLHVWSTRSASAEFDTLHAVHQKFHGRGVKFVGLCKNAPNEQEKVAAVIKTRGLTWPQLYDGKEAHGELYEAYFGTRVGRYCVIVPRKFRAWPTHHLVT